MTIIAAADGSALGNPGPAGWAWYIDDDRWAAGGWPHGTNNMGELTAVLDLLRQTAHLDDDVLIFCDSRYVINSITQWMPGWKRNGWRKKDRKPVLNLELMKSLDAAMAGRRVSFEWVKGHAGHPLNEAADRLANAAAVAWQNGGPPAAGPGIAGSSPSASVSPGPGSEAKQEPAEAGNELDLFSDLPATERAHLAPLDPTSTDEQIVLALERSLLTDEVRGDPAEVAALLHPDWQEIGASGRLWSRADMLAEIGPLPPTTLEVLSLTRVAADAVLLVWRSASDRGTALRSSLWIRSRGRWRQRFHQGATES